MMHLYSTLLYIVYTKSSLQSLWGGGGLYSTTTNVQHPLDDATAPQDSGTRALQVERRESHRANQVDALATHQLQCRGERGHRATQVYALTTHKLHGGEERVS